MKNEYRDMTGRRYAENVKSMLAFGKA